MKYRLNWYVPSTAFEISADMVGENKDVLRQSQAGRGTRFTYVSLHKLGSELIYRSRDSD
jgi:hypothetical protein